MVRNATSYFRESLKSLRTQKNHFVCPEAQEASWKDRERKFYSGRCIYQEEAEEGEVGWGCTGTGRPGERPSRRDA